MWAICVSSPLAEYRELPQGCAMKLLRNLALVLAGLCVPADLVAEVDFSREILPVLSDYCFHCHGPDPKARKGELRLDDETDAKRPRDGYAIIAPGKSSASELLKRIITDDLDERMPPPEMGRDLPPAAIEKIRQWLDEGAPWGRHWALTPIVRPETPTEDEHPIDSFINAKLNELQLPTQPPADRATLIRRLHLDLTGLPPAPETVQNFLNDERPIAWLQLIKDVMDKPAYGERMAWPWLNAARYADSNGYQGDSERTMWPWRDWVVRAFNENMPWDQFTEWQLAGDLFPNPTFEQRLATGFNRNHMINGEGGRISEENRVDYVMDMTETTGTIWLGLTFNCSRCHDHKFDAITQNDYYSLSAFFNQTPVTGAGRSPKTPPILTAPSAAQRKEISKRNATVRELSIKLKQRAAELAKLQPAWEAALLAANKAASTWETLVPITAKAINQSLSIQKDRSVLVGGKRANNDTYTVTARVSGKKITGIRLETLKHKSLTKGSLSRSGSGNYVLTGFEISKDGGVPIKIASAKATFEQGGLKITGAIDGKQNTGWGVWKSGVVNQAHGAVFTLAKPLSVATNSVLRFTLRHDSKHKEHLIGNFRLSYTEDAKPQLPSASDKLLNAVRIASAKRTAQQAGIVAKEHQSSDKQHKSLKQRIDGEKRVIANIEQQAPKVMIMEDMKQPRDTFVLTRGLYNKPGDKVFAAVPASLSRSDQTGRTNRLQLAKWLTARDNPLMARVTVNRFWQMLFGIGIVKTPEDFGVQSEFPKHPELLDWLAAEFIESGWDVKHLLTTILTSETYQRSSTSTPELNERDPMNRYLARAPRHRLPSWMIRDQALAVSGLLNAKLGGAPVNGYQPAGIWEEATFGKKKYKQDSGDKLYRRSLYTFWRRIVGPTMFFDSAKRQICEVKTPRTNTPLHALTTLNDTTYVEAARAMAQRILLSQAADVPARIGMAYQLALSRMPTEAETKIWMNGLNNAGKQFAADKTAAMEFLQVGESKRDESLDPNEHATLAAVCLGILNLDETLNRE